MAYAYTQLGNVWKWQMELMRINCHGLVELLVKIGQNMCRLNFLVVGGVKIGILGLHAMGKLGVVLNTKDKVVTLTGTPSKESREEIPSKCYHIRLIQSCDIKPFEENSKIKMSILQMMHILKVLNIFKRELGF